MEKIFKVEIVGRVCIVSEAEGDAGGAYKRLTAGTPKMVGDAVRIVLTNAIASSAIPEAKTGGGL